MMQVVGTRSHGPFAMPPWLDRPVTSCPGQQIPVTGPDPRYLQTAPRPTGGTRGKLTGILKLSVVMRLMRGDTW